MGPLRNYQIATIVAPGCDVATQTEGFIPSVVALDELNRPIKLLSGLNSPTFDTAEHATAAGLEVAEKIARKHR